MTTYIMLANWTDQGVRSVAASPSRLDAAKQAIKEMGGEVIELTPEERARWVEASKVVFEQFSTAVPPEVVQEIRDTVAKAN